MKPRSGLRGVRAASCFFATIASDAESVRDLTIVSSRLSKPSIVSHPRAALPIFAAHPERSSLEAPLAVERGTQLPGNFPFFATHSTGSCDASGRRDTEYISAARDEPE